MGSGDGRTGARAQAETAEELARLLARRVEASGQPADGEVSVAELRRRLVPYEVARTDLALATKAEYDLAMLELLASGEYLETEDGELVAAVRRELDSPEPGLAFLQDFAASHLQLRLEGLAEASADSPAARRATAAADGPELRPDPADAPEAPPGTSSDAPSRPASASATDRASGPVSGPTSASEADRTAGPTAGAAADGPGASCWRCEEALPSESGEARYCVWCGADLSIRPCRECGTELQAGWAFCPSCGREAGEAGEAER